jgi:hypothetical protein
MLLNHFSKGELIMAGGEPDTMYASTLVKLDLVRELLDIPVFIVKNGLNSGDHRSPYHDLGLAVDAFPSPDLFADLYDNDPCALFRILLKAGFTGIGIYRHRKGFWGFHADERLDPATWLARPGKKGWIYSPLITVKGV